jgi:2-alkenal reductase
MMLTKRLLAAFAVMAVLATGCANLPLSGILGSDSPRGAAAQSSSASSATETGVTTNVSAPAAIAPTPTAVPASARAQFDQDEMILVNLYERVNPAVVSIANEQRTGGSLQAAGSGSGFVISADGYIVTNNHVIEDADRVDVIFADGAVARAVIVGADRYSDLALLKVEKTGLPFVELANSDEVKVGQRVIAIGNPFGLNGTMTEGIVSAKGRTLPEASADGSGNFSNPSIIQTDAAINPGNSGGPLLDSSGRVVGVNTAIRTTNGSATGQPSNSGIGFAVPANTVKRVVDALKEDGRVRYPYLGIQGAIRVNQAQELNLPITQGVMPIGVVSGGPVADAGLRAATIDRNNGSITRAGDVIIAFNGTLVKDYDDLIARLIETTQPGDTATLRVWRNGQEVDLQVVLGERPQ